MIDITAKVDTAEEAAMVDVLVRCGLNNLGKYEDDIQKSVNRGLIDSKLSLSIVCAAPEQLYVQFDIKKAQPSYSKEQQAAAAALYQCGYRYIAKDRNGNVHVYDKQPCKSRLTRGWVTDSYAARVWVDFPQINWSDNSPVDLKSIFKENSEQL